MQTHGWTRDANSDQWVCVGCELTVTGETCAYCTGGRNRPPRTAHAPCGQCDPHPAPVGSFPEVAISDKLIEALKGYTDDYCVRRANQRNRTLASIPRMTTWGSPAFGRAMVIPRSNGRDNAVLEMGRDYERVRFAADAPVAHVLKMCDAAIDELGARMDCSLVLGNRLSRSFTGSGAHDGLFPIDHWGGDPVTLYSVGTAPRMFTDDGISVYRCDPLKHRGMLEVRFGWYGQLGPSMPNSETVAMPAPRAKYSGACPCGINASDCHYHREAV